MKTEESVILPAEIHLVGRETRDSSYRRELKRTAPPRRYLFQMTLAGSGRVGIGKNIHPVGKNQALFVPAPSPYYYEAVGHWEFVHLSVKSNWAPQVSDSIHERFGPVLTLPEGSRALRMAMETLERVRANDLLSVYESASMACRFLLALLDDLEGPPAGKRPRFIEGAIFFIRRNLGRSLRVVEIARRSGFSREHFTREFIRHVGLSPAGYIWGVRVSEGASLLSSTSLTLKEIARKIGFADSLTFSRAFHRRFGMSPTGWRNEGPV